MRGSWNLSASPPILNSIASQSMFLQNLTHYRCNAHISTSIYVRVQVNSIVASCEILHNQLKVNGAIFLLSMQIQLLESYCYAASIVLDINAIFKVEFYAYATCRVMQETLYNYAFIKCIVIKRKKINIKCFHRLSFMGYQPLAICVCFVAFSGKTDKEDLTDLQYILVTPCRQRSRYQSDDLQIFGNQILPLPTLTDCNFIFSPFRNVQIKSNCFLPFCRCDLRRT